MLEITTEEFKELNGYVLKKGYVKSAFVETEQAVLGLVTQEIIDIILEELGVSAENIIAEVAEKAFQSASATVLGGLVAMGVGEVVEVASNVIIEKRSQDRLRENINEALQDGYDLALDGELPHKKAS